MHIQEVIQPEDFRYSAVLALMQMIRNPPDWIQTRGKSLQNLARLMGYQVAAASQDPKSRAITLTRATQDTIAELHRDVIYTDGGLITSNPSEEGGTWAYVRIKDGGVVAKDSGWILPEELGVDKVTNNHSELYAVVRALEDLPILEPHWAGTICTDSNVTLHRMTQQKEIRNCPPWLQTRAMKLRSSLPNLYLANWFLLTGHPTKTELKEGVDKDKGRPVSIWNKWCDTACNEAKETYLSIPALY